MADQEPDLSLSRTDPESLRAENEKLRMELERMRQLMQQGGFAPEGQLSTPPAHFEGGELAVRQENGVMTGFVVVQAPAKQDAQLKVYKEDREIGKEQERVGAEDSGAENHRKAAHTEQSAGRKHCKRAGEKTIIDSQDQVKLTKERSAARQEMPEEILAPHSRLTGEIGNPSAVRPSAPACGGFTWSWMESKGVWREYDPDICDVVEQAFVKGQSTVCASQDHVS